MFKKMLFKQFSHGHINEDGVFVNTGRKWFVGGVLVHESEWDKYNFRTNGKKIPEFPTVDWSLKFRQNDVKRFNDNFARMPLDLQADVTNRFING